MAINYSKLLAVHETRLCRNCRRELTPDHFSMFNSEAVLSTQNGGHSWVCNECRVKGRRQSFLAGDAPDWSLANCKNLDPWQSELYFFDGMLSEGEILCSTCPLKAPCLEYGRRTASEGLWGGVRLNYLGTVVKTPQDRPGRPPSKACSRGHKWDEVNTAYDGRGYRYCRTCSNNRRRNYERENSKGKKND